MEERLRGAEFADSVERQITGAVQGVGEWWQDASADQEGWGDDALRLLAGGAKNVAQGWQDASADQEGVFDDLLRLTEGGVKNTFRVLDAGSFYGGEVGGQFAKMLGWDPRIGGFVGNIGGDLLLGGAIAKAPKYATKGFRAVSRTDTMIGRLAADQRYKNIMRQAAEIRANPSIPLAGEYTYFNPKLASPLKQELIDGVPTYVLKKRNDQNLLREVIWNTLEEDSGLRAGILDKSIDRNSIFGNIGSPSGDAAFAQRRIQGISQMIKAIDEGGDKKKAFEKLTFGYKSTANEGNLQRYLRMQPPKDGSVEALFRELIPDDPEAAADFAKRWKKQQMVGFNRVQEAARQKGLTLKQIEKEIITGKKTLATEKFLEQFDAGHWFATYSDPHPLIPGDKKWKGESRLWNRPTTDRSARIEPRKINQAAKADIEHDLNPFAAKKIGVPRTWEEDIRMWLSRELNTGEYPDWYELGTKYMDWAEDITWNMPEAEVNELFEIFEAQIRKDPTHWSNQRMKEIIEDLAEAKEQAAKRAANIKANLDELEGPMTKAEAAAYDAELLQKR